MDDVIACIVRLGKKSLIAKMDIKQAYRNVPIHPDDRPLLGMKWRDQVFVDKALPFSLRSAPLIFTALADCLQWIMQRRGADPLALPLLRRLPDSWQAAIGSVCK